MILPGWDNAICVRNKPETRVSLLVELPHGYRMATRFVPNPLAGREHVRRVQFRSRPGGGFAGVTGSSMVRPPGFEPGFPAMSAIRLGKPVS